MSSTRCSVGLKCIACMLLQIPDDVFHDQDIVDLKEEISVYQQEFVELHREMDRVNATTRYQRGLELPCIKKWLYRSQTIQRGYMSNQAFFPQFVLTDACDELYRGISFHVLKCADQKLLENHITVKL